MEIRVAGIVNDSITDGPGLRLAVFAQGCPHGCLGCHNPETHDQHGGYLCSISDITEMVRNNPLLAGVTFTGGEPFLQAPAFTALARDIKAVCPDLSIFTYTGYTWEELLQIPEARELIGFSDYIVDGRFYQNQRSLELLYRGSKNQRIIDAKESLASGTVVIKEY